MQFSIYGIVCLSGFPEKRSLHPRGEGTQHFFLGGRMSGVELVVASEFFVGHRGGKMRF